MIATPERPARRPIGRPRLTDRDTIIAAALDIGFADLTVGKVTEAVGVRYSTMWRSIPHGIGELRAAMVDAVLDGATWPADGLAWRPHLEQLAATLAGLVRGHPGLAEQLAGMPSPPERIRVERARAIRLFTGRMLGGDAIDVVDAVILAATVPPPVDDNDEDRLSGYALAPLVLDGIALRTGGGA